MGRGVQGLWTEKTPEVSGSKSWLTHGVSEAHLGQNSREAGSPRDGTVALWNADCACVVMTRHWPSALQLPATSQRPGPALGEHASWAEGPAGSPAASAF